MNVLLAVSGGIAAYKAPDLVRRLQKNGATVRCLCTDNASRLVAKEALFTLSSHPVHTELWPQDGSIPHIELVRWCEAMLVAPATANCLAKFALGLADDLLTTCYLAIEPDHPVWLAPAMNTVMWNKPVVQGHLATLKKHGCRLIDPVSGNLACGEDGIGAMADPQHIADTVCGA
jgi:phosphopantothenoylcysteine decarboxylase/phosphopantothenate--cysteine ligase